MFVNAIRALSQSGSGAGPSSSTPAAHQKTALGAYTTSDALDAVAGLLAAPYPVLLNEGLVALSLASLSHRSAVEEALLRPSRVQTAPAQPKVQELDEDGQPKASSSGSADSGKGAKRVGLEETAQVRPVDKLASVLLPSPGSGNVGPEIKANAATLAKSVGGRVADIVKEKMGDEAKVIAMDK